MVSSWEIVAVSPRKVVVAPQYMRCRPTWWLSAEHSSWGPSCHRAHSEGAVSIRGMQDGRMSSIVEIPSRRRKPKSRGPGHASPHPDTKTYLAIPAHAGIQRRRGVSCGRPGCGRGLGQSPGLPLQRRHLSDGGGRGRAPLGENARSTSIDSSKDGAYILCRPGMRCLPRHRDMFSEEWEQALIVGEELCHLLAVAQKPV